MRIQHKQSSSLGLIRLAHIYKLALLLVAVALPSLVVTSSASAQAKVTSAEFCSQFTDAGENLACKDGWKGVDCSDYLITHDQKHVDICQKGAKAALDAGSKENTGDSGTKTDDKPDKETGGNTNSSNNGGGDSKDILQQMIDQTRQLQELNGEGAKNPDKVPDNNYGQYVNGRGELQPIRVQRHEGTNRAAIIFFNGGGWHSDDGVGDKIAPKAVERGYATFVASYRLGSSGIYYMFEDVMRAIRHVRNNAAMYGVDPNRIAVWGDSAGGSLAMRAAASGKSGAAAAVGWSAPTNAYTAIFRSPDSFAIGMDHSTCVPTDLNGVANILDQLNGGEGNLPDDGGLGNNGTAGTGTALGTVSEVLNVAQTAQQAGKNAQQILQSQGSGSAGASGSVGATDTDTSTDKGKTDTDTGSSSSNSGSSSSSSESGGDMEQNVRRLAARKILQCLDNFNAASPALFASPLSPPTFLAGFNNDPLVGPDQAYQLRDKLRSLGVPSAALIVDGEPGPKQAGKNHLDYNEDFVGPSLDFLDQFLHPTP